MYSPLEQFDAILLTTGHLPYIRVFSILVPSIIALVFFLIITNNNRYYKIIPGVLQSVFESIIIFVFNIIKDQIGKKGLIYFPMILALFLFILGQNLLSLMPFGIALTSHLILILWFSLSLSVGLALLGLNLHGWYFFRIFMPEAPLALLPMLICIEIFSYIIKAFSLAIRLAANIMAGHTLVYIISSFVLKISVIEIWYYGIGFIILSLILCLELGVAFLQAYVFVVLLCIYLNDTFHIGH